jgi:hypothetical protein
MENKYHMSWIILTRALRLMWKEYNGKEKWIVIKEVVSTMPRFSMPDKNIALRYDPAIDEE